MSNTERYKFFGHVLATVHIGQQRKRVGWMYREEPDSQSDSGWRFFSGEESQEFVDDSSNTKIYAVTTILEIDPTIEPYLDTRARSAFERAEDGLSFRKIEDFAFAPEE